MSVLARNQSAADMAEFLAGRGEEQERSEGIEARHCDECGGREVRVGGVWKHTYMPRPCDAAEEGGKA